MTDYALDRLVESVVYVAGAEGGRGVSGVEGRIFCESA